MIQKALLLILTTLLLISCDNSTQYGVYVANSTGEDIVVSYKTEYDEKGTIEKSITLKNGQSERIIWSVNMPNPTDDHCHKVAEYITATIRSDVKSNLEWCSDAIRLETTDIGQKEYMIDYKLSDFNL